MLPQNTDQAHLLALLDLYLATEGSTDPETASARQEARVLLRRRGLLPAKGPSNVGPS